MSKLSSIRDIDYRQLLIARRFSNIKRTLFVMSGKGGVGKSLISALTALLLSKSGMSVGLLDLDLHGPSSTAILGIRGPPREEETGLIPPHVAGIKVMSVDLFVGGRPLPIGGFEKREVIRELLALTDWGSLDLLVVDMPPETGDVTLVAAEAIPGMKTALLITIPSRLSLQTVKRTARILRDMKIPILGIIENMAMLNIGHLWMTPFGRDQCEKLAEAMNIPYLGRLPLDPQASQAADNADVNALLETELAKTLKNLLQQILHRI